MLARFLLFLMLSVYAGPGVLAQTGPNTIRQAAERGDPEAQMQWAERLYHGRGMPRNWEEAAVWFRRAAEQGHPVAQYALGDLHIWGHGVRIDREEAERWYRLAAEQMLPLAERGDAVFQSRIARLYDLGRGLPEDPAEAARWYRAAAEQGFAPAQVGLGDMLRQGRGVAKDPTEANYWYEAAAAQGNKEAAKYLEDQRPLNRVMTQLKDLAKILMLPFVFYILWGPFAFAAVTHAAIKRQLARRTASGITSRTGIAMAALFTPVFVTSEGGNIPVLFPWWLAVVGDLIDPKSVDIGIAQAFSAIPGVMVILVIVRVWAHAAERRA